MPKDLVLVLRRRELGLVGRAEVPIIELAKELGGKDPHQGVNPDEVVAIGAAVQGAVLQEA